MTPPRSAYIHVPFCSHRCGYCNFTLVSGRDELVPSFLEAIEAELRSTLVEPQPVDTIFLGGGTPTHLTAPQLRQLLKAISHWLQLEPGGEFSCEANPLDCDAPRLDALREFGVNRLSLGGQSFCDRKLKSLERDHSGAELSEALAACAERFDNVSLDLIFAAPDETLGGWQADLSMALAAPIRHLSTYGLTIERGSAFYGRALRRELTELDSDVQLSMYQHAIDTLTDAGWQHYEVSNFAQPGYGCRHNEAYWLGRPWWAFGPGAAAFIHHEHPLSFTRRVNHRSPTTYLNRHRRGQSLIAEEEQLSLTDYVRERLVFGLRRLAGVDLAELERLLPGAATELFEPTLQHYVDQGWLERDATQVRLTRQGLVISDSLWPDLLSPD